MRYLGSLHHARSCFFAFLATVFVGVLAEDTFGFIHDKKKPIKNWNPSTRATNTRALGSALLIVNMVAMSGSLVIYILMLFTYPLDAKAMAAAERGRRVGGGGGEFLTDFGRLLFLFFG